MKITNLYLCMLLLLAVPGCKKNGNISFCEGVTPKGEKAKCGTTFTTGDLSAVITVNEPLGVKKVNLSIFEITKYKAEPYKSFSSPVDADKNSAVIKLSMYNEGTYRVKVAGKEKKTIAEGEIKIIDTY